MVSTLIKMPEELMTQVEETARTQNREPEELVAEAVRKYLKDRKWESFLDRAASRAKAKGLTEEDVPRLVREVRRENEARGR
jgi:metal-responsive CopG/Arc/MetJ family transcriptional regulator